MTVALRTTNVTPARRAAAEAALARSWRPGDPIAVRWWSAPTADELDGDLYRELDWCPAPGRSRAFVRGFALWLHVSLDEIEIEQAVPAAILRARRRPGPAERGGKRS